MFNNIKFQTRATDKPLLSSNLTSSDYENALYNKENLYNSTFSISGSVDSFLKPPVTAYALEHLFHMQDFNIFHYGEGSYTIRQNFHSFLILYTYNGCGTLDYKGKIYPLEKGTGFFIDCMEYHAYKVISAPWDTAVLHINGPLLPDFFQHYIQDENITFHDPLSGNFQLYLEQLLNLYSTPHLYRDWQVSNCISNMITYLLVLKSVAAAKKTEIPQNIQYLIKYIENNYTARLSLDVLSSFASMNKHHLIKEFKRYTGFSPNDYIISLRINQAKILLKTTHLPAIKIAHEVGIHDANNFTNLFKKKTGMTPIQYRNNTDFFGST